MSRRLFGRLRPPATQLVAAVATDGEYAQIVVAEVRDEYNRPTLVLDRATTTEDLPRLVDEVGSLLSLNHRRPAIRWIASLGGDAVHHEVAQVPPQLRAFQGIRLDATLATTRWGNSDAVEAAGYRLATAFDGDRCLIGVAHGDDLRATAAALPPSAEITSTAAGLAALLRAVNPDVFSAGGAPTIGMLCESTAIALCIVEHGQVRLLYQTGLADVFREIAPPRSADVPDGPVEFELGGSYTAPRPGAPPSKIASRVDLLAADVESEVYQAACIRTIQEALRLYNEQYANLCDPPQVLHLTGECVPRHALRAYLARQLGAQFEVDEIDAALAVRIDEPGEARRIAASQNTLGGALCALAAGVGPGSLTFDLDTAGTGSARNDGARAARAPVVSATLAAGLAAAVLVAVCGTVARFVWTAREHAALAAAVTVERERQSHLALITDERRRTEARLAHTRAVLQEFDRLRGRQSLPPELLSAIRSTIPPDTALDEVSLANGVVRITGTAERRERGIEFAVALEQLRDTFADVTPQVDTVAAKPSDSSTEAEAALDTYTFTISARYIRDLPHNVTSTRPTI